MYEYNFFKAEDELPAPMDTKVPGVFIAGARTRLVDVTDAVTRCEGAAERAAEVVSQQ